MAGSFHAGPPLMVPPDRAMSAGAGPGDAPAPHLTGRPSHRARMVRWTRDLEMTMRSGRARVRRNEGSAERRPGGRRLFAGLAPVVAITIVTLASPGPCPGVRSFHGQRARRVGHGRCSLCRARRARGGRRGPARAGHGQGQCDRFEIIQRSTLVALAGGPAGRGPRPRRPDEDHGRGRPVRRRLARRDRVRHPAGFSVEMRPGLPPRPHRRLAR